MGGDCVQVPMVNGFVRKNAVLSFALHVGWRDILGLVLQYLPRARGLGKSSHRRKLVKRRINCKLVHMQVLPKVVCGQITIGLSRRLTSLPSR
jgi:hypothetical protein